MAPQHPLDLRERARRLWAGMRLPLRATLRVRPRALQWALGAWLLAALVAPAAAAFTGQHHTSWSERAGAPTEIVGIGQAPDGYLWLASNQGLVRFDGLRFERLNLYPDNPTRPQPLSELLVQPDGTLWVALRLGGMVRVRDGALRHYGAADGLPANRIVLMVSDARGVVWGNSESGLYRLEGERWRQVNAELGLAPGRVEQLLKASDGSLLLKDASERWSRKAADAPRVQPFPVVEADTVSVRPQPDGTLWVWHRRGMLQRLSSAGAVLLTIPAPSAIYGDLLADARGDLWLTDYGNGLFRYSQAQLAQAAAGQAAGPPERLTEARGLSSDSVMNLFSDRQGQLWAGTAGGLDRVAEAVIQPVPRTGGNFGGPIAVTAQAEVCIGSIQHPTTCTTPDQGLRPLDGDPAVAAKPAHVLHADTQGRLWLGSEHGLRRRERDGRLVTVPYPDDTRRSILQSMLVDTQGMLWLAPFGQAVMRLQQGRWLPPDPRWPPSGALVLAQDAAGAVWMGTADGQLLRLQGERLVRHGAADGVPAGRILALKPVQDRLWVGGEAGLLLWQQGRAHRVRLSDGNSLGLVTGIVHTPDGALWLNEASGLLRIPPEDHQALLADPTHPVSALRLGPDDGLLGPLPPLRPTDSLQRGPDGQLWLTRASNIYRLDPVRVLPPPDARFPVPMIDSLGMPAPRRVTDGRWAVRYNAVDLASPQRLRFRYRLEGLDEDWQEAGDGREARYNNLPPGHYRFQVQARAGALAGWSDAAPIASQAFEVVPAWHQTWTFRASVLALMGLLAWLTWRWWAIRTARRIEERLQVQLRERERIARELHDNLLQGAMGLTLQVQAGLEDLPPAHPARRQLQTALERADAVLTATREHVQGLRETQLAHELGQALMQEAMALRGTTDTPAVRIETSGEARPLRAAAAREVYQIALEAVQNSLRHAQARHLDLLVSYGAERLEVCVSDDGRGLPAELDPDIGSAGHWGLRGMRERAATLGAEVRWLRRTEGGVRVVISVKAEVAYQGHRGRTGLLGRLRAWRASHQV